MKILGVIVALLVLFTLVACDQPEPLVTYDCTDHTATSLMAQGEVNSLEAGTLSRRGFVFSEGTTGDPTFNITPLANPSFEEGDPPSDWIYDGGLTDKSRESTTVKLDSYSLRLTAGDAYSSARQTIPNYEDYLGSTLTLGMWVQASSTNTENQGIRIRDSVGLSESAVVPKDDSWHWMTVTRTIDPGATYILIQIIATRPNPSTDVVYADGAILVEDGIFEDGEFGTGPYSLVITGLKPDTSYRVRAFVANVAGISYGNTVTCKTLP